MNRNQIIFKIVITGIIAIILSLALLGIGVLIHPPKVSKHDNEKSLYGMKIYDTSLSAKIIEIDSLRFIVLHKENINKFNNLK